MRSIIRRIMEYLVEHYNPILDTVIDWTIEGSAEK